MKKLNWADKLLKRLDKAVVKMDKLSNEIAVEKSEVSRLIKSDQEISEKLRIITSPGCYDCGKEALYSYQHMFGTENSCFKHQNESNTIKYAYK